MSHCDVFLFASIPTAPPGGPYISTQTYNDYYSKTVQGSELRQASGSNFITQTLTTASSGVTTSSVSTAQANREIGASSSQNGGLFEPSVQPHHTLSAGVPMSDVW